MGKTRTGNGRGEEAARVADRLHSAAIHLLRRLRVEDAASGLPAPRLSALSVIVFGGPLTLGDLAAAEQVRPPTITRLVRDLQADGLARVLADPADGRVRRVEATEKGRRVLLEGRRRRVERLAAELAALHPSDLDTLARAVALLEAVLVPGGRRATGSGSAPRAGGSSRSHPGASGASRAPG